MIFWTLLGVLTLCGVANAEAAVAPPDAEHRIIYRLFDFLISVDQPVKESVGYDRLRHVMNKTAEVLEFFEFIGDLYLDGALQACLQNATSDRCSPYAELGRFLARGKEVNTYEDFVDHVLPSWNPDGEDKSYNFWALRFYLALTFNNTLDAYNYLRTSFAGALLGKPSNEANLLQLRHCDKFLAVYGDTRRNDSWNSDNDKYHDTMLRARFCFLSLKPAFTLQSFVKPMAPDCEDNTRDTHCSESYGIQLQCAGEAFAQEHGLNGGYSNRCFAKFVIRYNNYSADANERFADLVATYLYQDTILHGLCVPIYMRTYENATAKRIRRKEWVMERVGIIGAGIFEARSVLDETPPIEAHMFNQTFFSDAVEAAIGEREIPYPTPEDAFQLYKGIYVQIMAQVTRMEPETKHRSDLVDRIEEPAFDVLVYYPAHDSTEHCIKNASDGILLGSVKNVNFVVSLRKRHNANMTLETKSKLEEYFKKSKKADQCERIDEINANVVNGVLGDNGLRALVSIKCAKKFVWYELAYQYFQAAYTEAPKVESGPSSKYSGKCGMLVMFP